MGEKPEVCLQTVEHAIRLAPATVEFRVNAWTLLIRWNQTYEAYELVRQVVTEDRVDLDCECCLWRVICIFDSFDDEVRLRSCYRQLRRSMTT